MHSPRIQPAAPTLSNLTGGGDSVSGGGHSPRRAHFLWVLALLGFWLGGMLGLLTGCDGSRLHLTGVSTTARFNPATRQTEGEISLQLQADPKALRTPRKTSHPKQPREDATHHAGKVFEENGWTDDPRFLPLTQITHNEKGAGSNAAPRRRVVSDETGILTPRASRDCPTRELGYIAASNCESPAPSASPTAFQQPAFRATPPQLREETPGAEIPPSWRRTLYHGPRVIVPISPLVVYHTYGEAR